jgi:hypothetical protein
MQSVIYQQVLKLGYELPEDGTDTPKYVAAVSVACKLSWFYK